jgi:hypothetical protein
MRPTNPKGMAELLVAVDDSAPVQVVRRELHLDAIAREYADVVAAHLSGDVRENLVVVIEPDAEHGVGQGLGNLALELDLLFFVRQRSSSAAPVSRGQGHNRGWGSIDRATARGHPNRLADRSSPDRHRRGPGSLPYPGRPLRSLHGEAPTPLPLASIGGAVSPGRRPSPTSNGLVGPLRRLNQAIYAGSSHETGSSAPERRLYLGDSGRLCVGPINGSTRGPSRTPGRSRVGCSGSPSSRPKAQPNDDVQEEET